MHEDIQKALQIIRKALEEKQVLRHACCVLEFDSQTICPERGMLEQGNTSAFLSNKAFQISHSKEFISSLELLYEHRKILSRDTRILVERLYWDYLRTKNITPEMDKEFSLVFNKAFVDWLDAKEEADFLLFEDSLAAVQEVNLKQIALAENAKRVPYDNLLDVYERGMTTRDLNRCFDECKERLVPMLKRILQSPKEIRTDFLSRPAPKESQREMTEYLLELLGFNFERGTWTTSEHPFTECLAKDDVRVTTHFHENMFYSNMFSIIHECGHALFEQNQPVEDFFYHISSYKTLGQHESVARFYENLIGRSEAFIRLVYPKCRELFPKVFDGVSEQQFYEAMNLVQPSLIRTEADEFTYTFHIIIRYEIEQMLVNKSVQIKDLPQIWNEKYEEYLGICPSNDREGILQDVYWTDGFGYFPTYALGNMYGAMYYNKMRESLDVDALVSSGDFAQINNWMRDHVWKSANRRDAKTWILKITGRAFTPKDFLDYLENKYSKIYGI